jgi:hypothetical protein
VKSKKLDFHLNAGDVQIELETRRKLELRLIYIIHWQGRNSDVDVTQRQEQPHGGGLGVIQSRADMTL